MTILVKNKHTLQIDEFKFKCCIGKNGSTNNKKEGDKKTPKGTFKIENLYYRKDRKEKPSTLLKFSVSGFVENPNSASLLIAKYWLAANCSEIAPQE